MAGHQAARVRRHPYVARMPGWAQTVARDLLVRWRHRGLSRADLMTVAYPKSGSTWLRFLLTSALTGELDVGFDRVNELSRGLGDHAAAPRLLRNGGRLVQSHERPRNLAPGQRPRVLYLVRDGRDVAISNYHHTQRWGETRVGLDEFVQEFLTAGVVSYGRWQDHVESWLALVHANPHTMMLLRYEDLLADPVESLLTVSTHFDLGLSETKVGIAVATNSAPAMRQREASARVLTEVPNPQPFVRSASSGQWRDTLSARTLERFDLVAGDALRVAGYATVTDV